MPEEHRKWVGADNSTALFRENEINGNALRSVDDVRAQLWGSCRFGITSASCGRNPAQAVKAVVSSFATTRGGTPGGPPEGGGLAAGLSPPTSAPQGRSTESVFHGIVQMLCEYIHDVVAVDQAGLLSSSSVFLRVGR